MKRFFMVFVSLVVSLTFVCFPSAYAQDTGEDEFILEDVIVTAERREQSQQDVPVSATVFTSENMEDKGINHIIDLQQFAPSLAINTYNRSTFINTGGFLMGKQLKWYLPVF